MTVDACSDSVSTLPYLARLAQEAENVEIRMVAPTWGQFLMGGHRSPDGRATTPTVILLDAGFRQVGCWVEQPTELQSWWLDPDDPGTSDERFARKMAWYENDGGRETVREVVEILEAAARGGHVCPQGSTPQGTRLQSMARCFRDGVAPHAGPAALPAIRPGL